MDSVAVTVPLRPPTKKMKKRKELDALAAPHAITRRNSGKRSSQELLTDSSEDRSEYWSVSTRGGRKCRGGRRSRTCPGFLRACSAFLACASILATATLIWLFIDVREQLSALRTELDQVIAGNQDLPDALQKYHSLSRDFQNNQTIIFANITDIKLQIVNFTTQLSSIQRGLHDVQETIRTAPELVNVPNQLKELSTEISRWGSRITDLVSTANKSKEDYDRIESLQNNVIKNITTIEHLLTDLSKLSQQPEAVFSNESKARIELMSSRMNEIATNLTQINSTLSNDLLWIKEDQVRDHKLLVETADNAQNVSHKVISLDNECAKIGVQDSLKVAISNLTSDLNSVKSVDAEVQKKLKDLQESINLLQDSKNHMLTSISELQSSRLNNTAQNIVTTQSSLSKVSVDGAEAQPSGSIGVPNVVDQPKDVLTTENLKVSEGSSPT